MLSSFHFTQIVNEPTRVAKNSSTIIDHIYLTSTSLLSSCSTSPPLGSSDHRSLLLSLNWSKCPRKSVARRIWNYARADWDTIRCELDTSSDNVDSFWSSWESHFLSTLTQHIPSRICKAKKSLPWLTPVLFKLLRKRNISFSKYKANPSSSNLSNFKSLRNKCVSAVRKAKCEFLNTLSSLIRSPKQFWSLYHSLSPNRQRIPPTLNNGSLTVESATSKANLFVSHFSACYSAATHSDGCQCFSLPSTAQEPGLSSVNCTAEEVSTSLSRLKLKTASGPDGLSSHMLRNTASAIASNLADLFNLSLTKGVLPSAWKLSNITPVFKGKGDPRSVTNYRPISLLSIPSKLLERIVHNRLLKYLTTNKLLSSRQFGFRPASSTQEALLAVTKDWSSSLDKGTSVAAVFFDLSKAFDKVPHCQLLSSLIDIGLSGSLLRWFHSYLSNRSQRVVVDGCVSVVQPVSSGLYTGPTAVHNLFEPTYQDPTFAWYFSSPIR